MLHITVHERDGFCEETNRFLTHPPVDVYLEHTLVSISKWEAKWNKPFINMAGEEYELTYDEERDYIQCMSEEPLSVTTLDALFLNHSGEIQQYIEAPHTATKIYRRPRIGEDPNKKTVITSEIIYFWMIQFSIPMETQYWHLNRLLTLIEVCQIKTSKEKLSLEETLMENAAINAARKARGG